jgi:U2-associated protein SR140
VFDHLATIYHSFPGRITADLFKKQITTVVDIWEDWIVFPPDFTGMLRQRLEGNVVEAQEDSKPAETSAKDGGQAFASKFKTSAFQPTMKPIEPVPTPAPEGDDDEGEPMDVSSDDDNEKIALYGEPVNDMDGKPFDDVDGEPVDDTLDGEPVDDLDGEPVGDDVDGEPMGADDLDGEPVNDVDGEPVDDLDGEPMS